MSSLLRCCLCLSLLAAAFSASAEGSFPASTRTVWSFIGGNINGESERIYPSGEAACQALTESFRTRYDVPFSGTFTPPRDCKVCSTTEANCGTLGNYSVQPYTGLGCPAGSAQSGEVCTCPSGTQPNSSATACVPSNACASKAGSSETRNFTIGYSRTSGREVESAWDAPIIQRGADLIGSTVCDGSCSATVSSGDSPKAWQAKDPNGQGLYRLSVDFQVTYTGATCRSSDKTPSLDSAAASPACDGYVGQVNGKTVCVGKKGTSDPIYTAPSPIQSGNPAAGSSGNDPLPSRTGGSGDAAGGPSSSSDGQIRGGTGSATGGSGGTGSSSTVDKEIKIEMCGSKGQPPCKIDESGTPDGKGAFSGGDAALQRYGDDRERGIRQSGDVSKLPWAPSSILLPSLGCDVQTTDTRLGVLKFDLCTSPIVKLWRDLLAWLLYMLTVLYCWRLAGGNIGNGGK